MVEKSLLDLRYLSVSNKIDQSPMQLDLSGAVGSIRPITAEDYDHVLRQPFPDLGRKLIARVPRNSPVELEIDRTQCHRIAGTR